MKEAYARYLLDKTQSDYNKIADQFAKTRKEVWFGLDFLFQDLKKGERILDLGCGNGKLYQIFKKKEVVYQGVDFSESLIKIAKEQYPEADFQKGDALMLPFKDNTFDKIYSLAVFHHIPSAGLRRKFLLEAKRILKKNGKLIITVWDLKSFSKAKPLILYYFFKKIFFCSFLDFGDIFYPWKNGRGETIINRYFHLFSLKELKTIAKQAGFFIEAAGLINNNKELNNFYLIGRKI